MIDINVLPEIFRPAVRSARGLALVVVFGLALVGMPAASAFDERAALARATRRNQDLLSEREVARQEKAKVDALRVQIAQAERRQNTIVEIAQSKICWSQKLTQLSRDDNSLNDALGVADLISSLTLDEVRKAAADWLAREPLVAVAMPATPAPQAAR